MSTEMILTPDSIDRFLNWLSENGSAANTVKGYGADLRGLMEWRTPDRMDLTLEQLTARFLTANREGWAPATTNRKKAAFRAYAKWMGDPTLLNAYRAPTVAPGIAHPIPDGMAAVTAIIEACRQEHHRVLLALCGYLGLRISEALAVKRDHFFVLDDGMWLRVRGKGDKSRDVPVGQTAASVLALTVVKTPPGQHLVHLTDRAARRAINRAGERAGYRVASHDFRMTFGSHSYDKDHDLRAAQELLGHADSGTTQGYTQVKKQRLREVADVA